MTPTKDNTACLARRLRYNTVVYSVATASWMSDVFNRRRNRIVEYPERRERVAVVTGGSRGLGLEVVRGLLKCGMRVVMAVRDTAAGQCAVDELSKEGHADGVATVMRLDVGSMRSVERFVEEFKRGHSALHLLVNNAGVMRCPYRITQDGFESMLATNYMGHFYLTHLLMDRLTAAGDKDMAARVVNVSSCAHVGTHMHFDDFNMERSYYPIEAYARSKMAQILSTKYLNAMFEEKRLPVKVYAVHPGIVATELLSNEMCFSIINKVMKSPAQGAVSIVYAGVSPEVENKGGAYITNCREISSNGYSRKREHQERLFRTTMELLEIEEFGSVNCYKM